MKKLILTLAVLMLGLQMQGQDMSFRKLFVQSHKCEGTGSRQGCAVFGNYLFQFYDKNAVAGVFHLPDGAFVADIPMEAHGTYHNNNVEFSECYFREGDEFPLIYAGQENAGEHKVLVHRIWRDGTAFHAETVQEIILPSSLESGVWYPNIALDNQARKMYVTGYCNSSWNRCSGDNAVVLLNFDLPSPSSGSRVVLSAADIRSRVVMEFRVATQGACIRNGRIYQVFGVPSYGATSLCCHDLETGALIWSRDLASSGISEEPEGLDFYGDELVVLDVKGNIFFGIKN